jgi:ABC-type oligopeptide transport system substrate-binding subunit
MVLGFSLAACGPTEEELTCTAPQVLNDAGDECVDPEPTCEVGEELVGGECQPIECEDGFELQNGECVAVAVNEAPSIAGAADAFLSVGEAFDPLTGISASDPEDGNITGDIVVTGTVDVNTEGEYELTYTVTDSDGEEVSVTRMVSVEDIDIVYPTGFFNYKFADSELRHTFMAAAEKYLLNNQYAGVPLFANGSFNLYSWRLQLPVEEFVAVMGYGTGFGTMSADDSAVLMDDGQPGNAGEYTYRTTISTNPGTFNQWLYDTSTDSTLIGQYLDALYVYVFNADKTGYEVVPSMAASTPMPVESHITDTGKEVSTKWQITLRDDLEWFYHPNTDISALPVGHEVIDANDFVETFKLAVDNEWFRAISGGGDFLGASNAIAGMQAYVDGEGDWADVGIKKIDDLTFEFTFVDDQSNWNVRYWLSSFVMTPINMELYEVLGDDYGTSEEEIAYHGAYYLDYYEADKILRYYKNPVYHTPDEYFYTGYTFSVIEDSEIRFQEFLAGKTEATTLPTTEYENYKNYPGLRQVPGATTFRIMINGLETVEKQQADFDGSTWVPEPLLANQDFKQAMYHAIDRQKLAEEVLKTSTTNMFLFSNAYLVDAELGVPYRQTPQGQSVGEGLSPSTHGFNFDAAVAYYELALDALVEAGTYTAGTAETPTIIEVDFHIFSGSEAQELMGAYLKTAFEDAFQSSTHNINVQLNILAKDFPGIYYDYMMIGEFDLSIGGISGSTLDAASFLDTYSSDNRSGFSLNWGIDTSVAEIEVNFFDVDGVRHREMWSFDGIVSVLNGEKYISMGEEAEGPRLENLVFTPTSVTFDVTKFDSSDYENFTYTLYYYDLAAGYLEVEGQVDVAITTATVTIDGLLPGFEPSTYYNYLGDYEVHLSYDYTAAEDKSGSYAAPWWLSPAALTGEVTAAVDSATIVGTLGEGQTGVTAAKVVDGDGVDVAGAAVDFADLGAIAVTGLVADTSYFVEFTMADGNLAVVEFTTLAE